MSQIYESNESVLSLVDMSYLESMTSVSEWLLSPMNESCLQWMSHVSNKWLLSPTNESWLQWTNHVSNEWLLFLNDFCLQWMSHVSNEWVMSPMHKSCLEWMSRASNESCSSPRSLMGWLRLVGSIKSYVSFAKEPYKRDNILLKRPIILSILLIVATPYRRIAGWSYGFLNKFCLSEFCLG